MRRPRYPNSVLKRKTLEGLCSRLRDEARLGLTALCAAEADLPRPMRNALLVIQGRRPGQVAETLARWLEPEEIALLVRQELAAQRSRLALRHSVRGIDCAAPLLALVFHTKGGVPVWQPMSL